MIPDPDLLPALVPALVLALAVLGIAIRAHTWERRAESVRRTVADMQRTLATMPWAASCAELRAAIENGERIAAECDARARRLWSMLGRW